MLDWIALIVAGVGGLLMLCAMVRRRRRVRYWMRGGGGVGARYRRCPGGRRGVRGRLGLIWPWRWLVKRGCGYDLSGHLSSSASEVRCPECGRTSPVRQLMRRPRQLRLATAGVMMFILAASFVVVDPPGARRLAKELPTEALLLLEIGLADRNHEQFRWELIRRARAAKLTVRQEQWLVPRLIDDLRDDARPRNARDASGLLAAYWAHSEPALRAALHSDDAQQRLLAARIIRAHTSRPDEQLLRVTVEGLGVGHYADWWIRYTFQDGGTVRSGFEYVLWWYDEARPFIIESLEGLDAQQRLICAGIVAIAGDEELIPQCAEILVGHLRDNHSCRDAIFAARALYAYGPDIVPLIEHAIDSDDAQQRGLAEYLVYALLPDLAVELPAPAAPYLSTYRHPLELDAGTIPMPRVD